MRILHLVSGDSKHRLRHRHRRIGEDVRPEQLPHARCVRGLRQLGGDTGDAAAIHFERAEQRSHRLVLQRVGTSVPEQATLRHQVGGGCRSVGGGFLRTCRALCGGGELREGDGLVLLIVRADAEVRLALQIHERGYGAHALLLEVRAAKHRG